MPDYDTLAPVRTEAQLRAEADKLRAHPQFDGALKQYTKDILDYRRAVRSHGKLIANEDRFRVINFFFPLWAESLAAGGTGALTYGELYEVCRRGEVTHRVLKNTLSLAVHLDFLTRTPNPADRRSWLYMPTPAMARFPYLWLEPATVALDGLVPGQSLTARLHADQAILIHFFRSAGRELNSGLQPARMVPDYMHFSGHNEGGGLLAMALLVAEMDNLPLPSRNEVAAQFSLSKSQVGKLMAIGVDMGLLTVTRGLASPTQAMRDGNADWVAVALAFLHHHLRPTAG